jgi:hypothetical protein
MLYTRSRVAELAAIRLTDIADLLPIRIANGKGGKDEIAAAAGGRQAAAASPSRPPPRKPVPPGRPGAELAEPGALSESLRRMGLL